MINFHCNRCGTAHTGTSRDLVSTHRTSEGPIAYVRCPHGHLSVVAFDSKTALDLKAA